ncbi:MAG: hypothetical protein AAGB04_17205, partial [Pseudomonadota bacterium]
ANEVARTVGSQQPEIRRKSGTSFNTIVDELVEHRTALAEFGYYSAARAWRADLISVGTVEYCACVCHERDSVWLSELLQQDFRSLSGDYDSKVADILKGKTTTIREAYKLIDECYPAYPTSLIAQTGTTIEDEFESTARQYGETNRQRIDDWETPYSLMRDTLSIFLTIQSPTLGQGGKLHSHLAFLDWRIACNMASRYDQDQDCHFLMLKYSEPLQVGYFTPKDDLHFRSVIHSAAQGSLLSESGSWTDEVLRDMERNLISPNPNGPTIITST